MAVRAFVAHKSETPGRVQRCPGSLTRITLKEHEVADVHSTVEEAQRAMWGPTAEAQALIELYRTASCDASVSTLAMAILERYVDTWQALSSALYAHGCPPLLPQVPASGDVEP